MNTNSIDRKLLLCAATFTALSAAACAEPAMDEEVQGSESDTAAYLQPANQGIAVRHPEDVWFASVVPTGTGCRPGTTNVSISDDGQVFTVVFSEYELSISPEIVSPRVTKDCTLQIKLNSPNGLSYAVHDFYFTGYSFLEENVIGYLEALYWFQGRGQRPTQTNRVPIRGPKDEGFLYQDTVKTSDAVWSDCGVTRDLNVLTRIHLQNSTPKRNGYMNVAAIDGSTKLEFRLAFRSCNGETPTNVLPDAGSGVIRR